MTFGLFLFGMNLFLLGWNGALCLVHCNERRPLAWLNLAACAATAAGAFSAYGMAQGASHP